MQTVFVNVYTCVAFEIFGGKKLNIRQYIPFVVKFIHQNAKIWFFMVDTIVVVLYCDCECKTDRDIERERERHTHKKDNYANCFQHMSVSTKYCLLKKSVLCLWDIMFVWHKICMKLGFFFVSFCFQIVFLTVWHVFSWDLFTVASNFEAHETHIKKQNSTLISKKKK